MFSMTSKGKLIFDPILFFSIKFEAVYLPGGGYNSAENIHYNTVWNNS